MSQGIFCSECDIISCREYGTRKKLSVCITHAQTHTLSQYSPSTDTVPPQGTYCDSVCGFHTPAIFLQQGLDEVFSLLRYVLKTFLIKFVEGSSHKRQSLSITVPLERRFPTESRI